MKRITRQRKAIWEAIEESTRPLSPHELLAIANRQLPQLGIATVYRALNDLVVEGQLVPVQIPGQPPRYEKANLEHHHHFYCKTCGRVYDLDGCLLKPDYTSLPRSFTVEGHEITLYGTCDRCT